MIPGLAAFASRFADVERRDRQVLVMRGHPTLGSAEYSVLEFYCAASDCDCRLVMFGVIAAGAREPEAWISWCFEPQPGVPGPELDAMHSQGPWAAALLEELQRLLARDENLRLRIAEHYGLMKGAQPKGASKAGRHHGLSPDVGAARHSLRREL